MNGKSVREIAEEIGVSKQAIFKKMKREPLSTSLRGLTATVDGRLTVSVDGERLIKQAFQGESVNQTDNQTDNQTGDFSGLVDGLKAALEDLRGQLAVKDKQIEQQGQTIENLSAALAAAQQTAAAAQALHAGTLKQQIESLPPITGELASEQQKEHFFSRFFKRKGG